MHSSSLSHYVEILCSRVSSVIVHYRKLKQLVALLLGLVLLDSLSQNVNGFCVADAPEARLRNMLQPVLDLRIRVPIDLCSSEVVQVLPIPCSHACLRIASQHALRSQLFGAGCFEQAAKTDRTSASLTAIQHMRRVPYS